MTASIPHIPPRYKSSKWHSSSHCTHRHMTRLYDRFGRQRCMICHRIPDFGYLYCCTQDTNGDLPASEFIDENIAVDLADLKMNSEVGNHPTTGNMSANTLKATIYKEGSQDDDNVAIDEDLARAFDGKRKFESAFPPEPPPQAKKCDLKICHACRPVYRDRAWQSLNQTVDRPVRPPPQYELENRRVSDATTVSGLRVPSDAYPHPAPSSKNTLHAITPIPAVESIPQMRQISHNLPSIFAKKAPAVATTREPPVEDGASDADDEKGFAKDDDTETSTDTSDADFTNNSARAARRKILAEARLYHYGIATVNRPRSATSIHQGQGFTYGGEQQTHEGRGTGHLTVGGNPERKLSPGRFLID